jgi:hypothetical protein
MEIVQEKWRGGRDSNLPDPAGNRHISRTFSHVKPEAIERIATPNPAKSGDAGETRAKPPTAISNLTATSILVQGATDNPHTVPNPRAALLAHLAGDMAAALAAGDTEAARIAHEAVGRLLGAPACAGDDVAGAVVVDLAAERTRRS